jgi:hypothetical protein
MQVAIVLDHPVNRPVTRRIDTPDAEPELVAEMLVRPEKRATIRICRRLNVCGWNDKPM